MPQPSALVRLSASCLTPTLAPAPRCSRRDERPNRGTPRIGYRTRVRDRSCQRRPGSMHQPRARPMHTAGACVRHPPASRPYPSARAVARSSGPARHGVFRIRHREGRPSHGLPYIAAQISAQSPTGPDLFRRRISGVTSRGIRSRGAGPRVDGFCRRPAQSSQRTGCFFPPCTPRAAHPETLRGNRVA